MFYFGVSIWILGFVGWLVCIINGTCRKYGLYWYPLAIEWLGVFIMSISRVH